MLRPEPFAIRLGSAINRSSSGDEVVVLPERELCVVQKLERMETRVLESRTCLGLGDQGSPRKVGQR